MSKADEYRARAVECESQAEKAKSPDAKWQFEEAARRWHEMADLAERDGINGHNIFSTATVRGGQGANAFQTEESRLPSLA